MAERKPLVLINGRVSELPVADTVTGAPAGPAGPAGPSGSLGLSSSFISALGTTMETATPVSNNAFYTITVADTPDSGILLPVPSSGSLIGLANTTSARVFVYTQPGGTIGSAYSGSIVLQAGDQIILNGFDDGSSWGILSLSRLSYTDGGLLLNSEGNAFDPASVPPPARTVKLFARSYGGRMLPAVIGPSGLSSALQTHLGRNGFALWKGAFGTAPSAIGAGALTAVGTGTNAGYAVTSLHTRSARYDYLVTAATTSAIAGYRTTVAAYRTLEGFHHLARVCPATGATVATSRFFCGMSGSAVAPTDVNPSSLVNHVGVCYDSGDTTFSIISNDGAGVATKINTGIPKPTTDRQTIYSVYIFAPPGGASIGVGIQNELTGEFFEHVFNADVPVSTVTLAPRAYHSVGGTSSVVGLALFSLYMETDN